MQRKCGSTSVSPWVTRRPPSLEGLGMMFEAGVFALTGEAANAVVAITSGIACLPVDRGVSVNSILSVVPGPAHAASDNSTTPGDGSTKR